MRIALDMHTVGMRQTGNETYIRNLATSLAEMQPPGFEFHYYHTLPRSKLNGDGWGAGSMHRLRPHTPFVRIPFAFPAALWNHKIDLAHFQYVSPPFCPCKTVVTIHDISFEFFPDYFPPLQRARMRMLIPASGRRADHVITISEFSKRQLIDTYGMKEDKISVTYLGVAPAFRPLPDADAEARLARFALSRPYILGVGNLQPRKNILRLIRAFAELRRTQAIPHQLVLVGQMAWKGTEILRAVEDLGLLDAVTMTGYVTDDELVALYGRAAVFVYPSLYEGFGLPILEAMACATPVVTSDVSSMPEVAGDAALLVDPTSEAAIADAVGRVLNDSPLAAAMKLRGLEQSRRFSWPAAAEQTAKIYRRLI
jgi:glycosyltransferase involved in cell wall biosynthesis